LRRFPLPGQTGKGDIAMPRYVILGNWTEQGAQIVTETTKRAEQVTQMVAQMGGRMETLLWTQGRYDLVGAMEAPDSDGVAELMAAEFVEAEAGAVAAAELLAARETKEDERRTKRRTRKDDKRSKRRARLDAARARQRARSHGASWAGGRTPRGEPSAPAAGTRLLRCRRAGRCRPHAVRA
jgi:uncharacterized protein with GYD domain